MSVTALEPSTLPESAALAALLKSASESIYFKDMDGRYLRVSDHTARVFQAGTTDRVIGRTDFDFYSRDYAVSSLAEEQQILASGEPILNKEQREEWADGIVTWASVSKYPLRNDAGETVGIFGLSRDISARKRAEERLAKTQAELVETAKKAAVAEFAGAVMMHVGSLGEAVAGSIDQALSHTGSVQLRQLRGTLAELPADSPPEVAKAQALAEELVQQHRALRDDLEELRQYVVQLRRVLQLPG